MKCKACGGQLVMREAHEYPIDENGVYITSEDTGRSSITMGVYCTDCGAGHAYDDLHESGDRVTIALEANSDPLPVATVGIEFLHGELRVLRSTQLVLVIAVDEGAEEIGQYLTKASVGGQWWERVRKLAQLIPTGEYSASFAEEEEEDNA